MDPQVIMHSQLLVRCGSFRVRQIQCAVPLYALMH